MADWPDRPAASTPGMTVRDQLDYVAWMAETAEKPRLHDGPGLDAWRQRVQKAYSSLVDSMVFEHGDPLPPDVPPSVQPGLWPDVPAAAIPGMTVRHQLTVLRIVAGNSRGHAQLHHNPADSDAWAARVQAAYDALDHGPALLMPDSARTASAAPLPKTRGTSAKSAKRRAGKKGASGKSRRSGKPSGKGKRAKPKTRGRAPRRR